MSLHHFQELVEGKRRQVRGAFVSAMEDLVRAEIAGVGDLDAALQAISSETSRLADLGWVRVEPISEMAREWLARNPEGSLRRLAVRAVRSVRRMGYSAGLSTIQPILSGRKRKTRGFIYRAVARQLGRGGRIPEGDRIRSPRSLDAAGGTASPGSRRMAEAFSRAARSPRPPLANYLGEVRTYLGKPVRSSHLRGFLALRVERAYGIPRGRAARLLEPGDPPEAPEYLPEDDSDPDTD
jgi:hypothetical protein